ncbi:hypothetical protein QWY82_15105 [Simiduia curdlanivorans]|uniref:Uncharacterized protein n=1 Tax=Simiduia curdlanivorans TaxID=1492769 RepID=A0ABV8V3T4_9GAMM|nr:hypothetical protein [Simiduia curdlanivorans]MDN3640127.1 hypothetical protein [Simiduia curdlanivorans]
MVLFRLLTRSVLPIVLLFAPVALHGAESGPAEVAIDLSFRYQTQTYSGSDASLWSTTLSPYVLYDNWVLGVDLPYQRVEGVFNFRGSAQQERNCELIASGTELPPRLEPYRDRLVARCATLSQENNTEEGVGDVNVYASYGRAFANTNGYWMWTLGYDGDNADEARQLGSGTRDMYLDFVAIKDYESLSLLFLVGYNYLLGGVNADLYDSYSYVGSEISSPKDKPWVFGLGVDYQYDSLEPIASARAFGQWRAKDALLFKVQVKGYEDSVYYPNSSVDASVLLSF